MLYTQKSFTLPVAQGVSKQEWDQIWKDWDGRYPKSPVTVPRADVRKPRTGKIRRDP